MKRLIELQHPCERRAQKVEVERATIEEEKEKRRRTKSLPDLSSSVPLESSNPTIQEPSPRSAQLSPGIQELSSTGKTRFGNRRSTTPVRVHSGHQEDESAVREDRSPATFPNRRGQ